MRRRGICYDAGAFLTFNWHPDFVPTTVRREMAVIRQDLHCNAVRISATGLDRLEVAAEAAAAAGLEVWLSPVLWDRTPDRTLRYVARAAQRAEEIRARSSTAVTLCIASELTLFMRGIVPGRTVGQRIANPGLPALIRGGGTRPRVRAFLARLAEMARREFHGPLTYASLTWEDVDWSLFDFVGVDAYRPPRIEERYLEMLAPAFRHGKPVAVTEFGYGTCQRGNLSEGFLGTAGLEANIVDLPSQFFHQLPVLGRFVRPHLKGRYIRDEEWQARKLVEQLKILDAAGVDGAFIAQFLSQITPYDPDPYFDLDMSSSSLVKYLGRGRHGQTYPDLPWDPKAAFHAVAEFYAQAAD